MVAWSDRRIIGFDATSALTQGGGIGRYTRELIRALVAEAPDLHFKLFSARPPVVSPIPDSLPIASNVTRHPAPFGEQWLYRLWYRARMPIPVQFFTGRLDLFHSPDFVLPFVGGRIPTLLTVHDLSFVHYPETFPSRLTSYLNRTVPWSIRRSDHILADSISTRNDLKSIWNVPVEKVTVIYGGVDERFQPASDEAKAAVRARYDLGAAPLILSLGTVQPRKNYEFLVRAFEPVARQAPHSLVIVGGKGWLDEGLSAEIERAGLTGRVRLAGFVADADLPALYSAADLFVFPSLYEGFGLPILEAMACGVPVITSNASSLPEVAMGDHGVPAAVMLSPHEEFAWTEAILRLLKDRDTRRNLAEAGLAQSTRFRWQKAAKELASLYRALLGKQKN
jgi:glycosyltransferase involved in cell wall biosynthesis